MKGVNFITDDKDNKIAVQIDLKLLDEYDEQVEELLDIIIIERRKNEPSIDFKTVKKRLQKSKKI